MKMWRFLLPGVGFLVLVGFFVVGLNRDPAALPSPFIGKPAPSFSLPSVDDPRVNVDSSAFAGKPWVLNVWGTWCPECRYEHPVLLDLAKSGVTIVGLDWKDERPLAQRWLRDLGNPFAANAFDEDGRVGIDWGVYGAPETFLIGANGQVLHKHIGALSPEVWASDFAPLLDGATP